jgi:PAS domain S-box-containing protein
MNSSDLIMAGSYNYGLVALSILIAMLGAYATIDLAGRVRATHGGTRLFWRIGGAIAMAIGTWAMHYTGMLAFRLPVPTSYDWPTSVLSFLPSLLASAVALVVVIRPKMESPRAFVASIFVGGGIAGLHYTAMSSMRFQGMDHFSPALVTLSVLLAIVCALLSLWLMFLFRHEPRGWKLRKVGSVALMGTAIWLMHYTGMASATYTESAIPPDLSHAVRISSLSATGIGAVALMVLAVALVGSAVDRIQKGKVLLDELFEQAPQAVILADADCRIVRVNAEFTRLFGYSPEEAVGRIYRELIVPDELQDEAQRFIDMLERGQRVETETIRRHKDGGRLYVSILHVPVSLPGGQIARYGIYRDITARKQAEEELKATTEQLRKLSASLQSALEEERTRIARELHDELGSALTVLKWGLEDISGTLSETMPSAEIENVRKKLATLTTLIDTTFETVRRISSELRPGILDEAGLVAAIDWAMRQFEARTGIVCRFYSAVEDVNLSREQSTAVFRIFQEALTNILRHAEATKVEIVIREEGDEFVLTISDNGKGITAQQQSGTETLGLLGMHERAHLIKGEVSIKSGEGGGTVVTVRVPIAGREIVRRATR